MIIPIDPENSTVNGTVNLISTVLEEEIPGLKDRIKQRLSSIIFIVLNNPGLRSNELAKLLNSTETAIRKDI